MTETLGKEPDRLLKKGMEKLPYLFLVILAYLVIIQIAPHLELAPRVDSSVYLYIGDRILKGDIPYRDVWDNKGPLIYYINAIGLAISGGSRWGVWCIELGAVICAALASFAFFKRAFGAWPAIFASSLFVLELRLVLDKGNMTEEYALPLQFVLLWLIWRAMSNKHPGFFFSIGVVAALCFLLRPNIIGIPLAFGLILLWQGVTQQNKESRSAFLVIAAGAFWILGITALFFLISRALPDLWDGMFAFNFVYNAGEEGGRWIAAVTGFQKMPVAAAFGIIAWGLAVLSLRSKMETRPPARILALLIVLGLPLEILLTSLSGFYFTHYYMSWLPILALSAAYALHFVSANLGRWGKGWPEPGRLAGAIALILMFILVLPQTFELIPEGQASLEQIWELQAFPEPELSTRAWAPVVTYAKENLTSDQPLVVWGHEVKINWLAERDPPIKYVYQTPFLVGEYMSADMAQTLIEELEANPPVIIDTGPPGGFMPSLTTPLEKLPEDLRPIYRYFQENYVYSGTFKSIGWDLYLFHGEGVPLNAD